jgi:ferredoxin
MGVAIYWFSGTGNSLHVARSLAAVLPDAELIPVSAAVGKPVPPVARLGLVFPVYGGGPPALMARFIEQLCAESADYVFAVVTHAGNPSSATHITQRLLRRRGLALSAAFAVRMLTNYPPFGGAPPPAKQEKLLERGDARIREVAAALAAWPVGHVERGNILLRWLGAVIYPVFRRAVARADRKFRVDEKCNGCGLCARICPVGNIETEDERPRWCGRCEQCYACFHWCPQEAIQYGRKTAGQVRYHHPECSAADFMIPPGLRRPRR